MAIRLRTAEGAARGPSWWRFAEQVCGRLTEPRIDVAAADREIELLLRESLIGSAFDASTRALSAAWSSSGTRAAVQWLLGR